MEMQGKKAVLLLQAKEASESPGVYLMKDQGEAVLYVGKAKVLKNRLLSYFQPAVHENPRTEMLVARIDHFDVVLTETEAEALILENTLIKRYKPKFNVRLKDDKAYPYLRIQLNDRFPKLEYVRRAQRDGARYFGPFPSAYAARQVADLLTEMFKLRDCSDNTFRHRGRPCILYQIGKCTAPCTEMISEEDYRAGINEVVKVLEGKAGKVIKRLRVLMEDAAQEENFEAAAYFRDQINNLEIVTETQGVVEAGSDRDRDVIGIACPPVPDKNIPPHGTLLRIRKGLLVGIHHYKFQMSEEATALENESDLVATFLSQYYFGTAVVGAKESSENPPKEILLPLMPSDFEVFENALGAKLRVEKNAIDRQLLNVARANAEHALEQEIKRVRAAGAAGRDGETAMEAVMDKLHLVKLPRRIECYDISNIQGEDAVASRVVFVDGVAAKNLYRRYKIRTVEGSNDFAMMKEVLSRRFSHEPSEKDGAEAYPDLLVVDGGKGQLSQATAILKELGEELGIQEITAVGLAKARTERDFQAKEVKASMERVFIPNRKNPVMLPPNTPAYRLLVSVRDEAHRFAVSYHRLLRSKRHFGA